MSDLAVLRANWTGFIGAPGYTTWYFDGPTASVGQGAMRTFFGFIADLLPDDVHIDVPTSGDVIDSATGTITGSWSGGSGGGVVGTDTGPYSAASGACVTWKTATLVNGRRLQGRSFIVPMGASSYDTTGQLLSGRRAVLLVAVGNALTTMGTHLVVWHRPTTPGGTDGAVGPVLSGTVPLKVSILRSRRD